MLIAVELTETERKDGDREGRHRKKLPQISGKYKLHRKKMKKFQMKGMKKLLENNGISYNNKTFTGRERAT